VSPVVGHDASNVPDGAEVVVSTAIAADNPEIARAEAVLHRADLLGELTRLKPCVAVGGTHGKTTTASMAAHVLLETGRAPSYLIGGELRTTGLNAAWGEGEWIVVEADESDRSFLKLSPRVAVVTNTELDHHATYESQADIEAAYAEFAGLAEVVIAPPEAGLGGIGFGIDEGELAATDVALGPDGSRFTVDGARCTLRVPGRHNVLNALAALAACREAGVAPAEAAPALATFPGAGRRFEWRGRTAAGAVVYDDYAHHPTEVRATLEAARTLGAERVVACFQPHLFSRTAALAREFGRALALADVACVLDVYPARERAEDFPGVSGWLVARAAADAAGGRPVFWTPSLEDAERALAAELRAGDLLLTLGAGDVDRLAEGLVQAP
jgi:UDP-N-acetylmuramate--alanine ligase